MKIEVGLIIFAIATQVAFAKKNQDIVLRVGDGNEIWLCLTVKLQNHGELVRAFRLLPLHISVCE